MDGRAGGWARAWRWRRRRRRSEARVLLAPNRCAVASLRRGEPAALSEDPRAHLLTHSPATRPSAHLLAHSTIRLLTRSSTHSITHSFTDPLTHPPSHPPTHPPIHPHQPRPSPTNTRTHLPPRPRLHPRPDVAVTKGCKRSGAIAGEMGTLVGAVPASFAR